MERGGSGKGCWLRLHGVKAARSVATCMAAPSWDVCLRTCARMRRPSWPTWLVSTSALAAIAFVCAWPQGESNNTLRSAFKKLFDEWGAAQPQEVQDQVGGRYRQGGGLDIGRGSGAGAGSPVIISSKKLTVSGQSESKSACRYTVQGHASIRHRAARYTIVQRCDCQPPLFPAGDTRNNRNLAVTRCNST